VQSDIVRTLIFPGRRHIADLPCSSSSLKQSCHRRRFRTTRTSPTYTRRQHALRSSSTASTRPITHKDHGEPHSDPTRETAFPKSIKTTASNTSPWRKIAENSDLRTIHVSARDRRHQYSDSAGGTLRTRPEVLQKHSIQRLRLGDEYSANRLRSETPSIEILWSEMVWYVLDGILFLLHLSVSDTIQHAVDLASRPGDGAVESRAGQTA
jgi:hypothetical protein